MATIYDSTASNAINGTLDDDYLYGWSENKGDRSQSGNDTLYGAGGNDVLYGGTDDDNLLGGSGNDTLDGGTGNDLMLGGTGDDKYTVDSDGDRVVEFVGEGIDTVVISLLSDTPPSFSYTLGDNVENLLGGAFINDLKGFGNALDNSLVGAYSSNNYLYGGDGNDSILGGDKSGNYLYGEGGNDTLDAGSTGTNLNYMDGGAGNDRLLGGFNEAGDILTGKAGDDELIGFLGNDTLTGGEGADKFVFNTPKDGIDTIVDFSVVDDRLVVSAGGFGAGLEPDAAIAPDSFTIGTAAQDYRDRFIYNSSNGALLFDADGIGSISPTQIASLSSGQAFTSANIFAAS